MPVTVDNLNMKKRIILLLALILGITQIYADQWGLASWYGGDFHGKKTANGEVFNTNDLTAAHNTLPFNTLVKVTNLYNQKSVIVRINDRGPFRKGRIIDLSKAAAKALNMLNSGVIPVRLEVVKNTGEKNPEQDHITGSTQTCRIQVGAFREAGNAERTKKRITAKKLKVFIETTKNGLYRVYVDQVSKKSLDETKKILHDLGFHDFIVKEH